ncbi:MAG: hypothetical protein AAF502_23665 [Bacteroidota bacterium]
MRKLVFLFYLLGTFIFFLLSSNVTAAAVHYENVDSRVYSPQEVNDEVSIDPELYDPHAKKVDPEVVGHYTE